MTQLSMILVRNLAAAFSGSELGPARLLAEAGLDANRLGDVYERIEISQYRRVVQAALKCSGDPAFGLHLGERLTVGSFDVIGHLTEHSNSLRDAIQVGVRYGRIVTDRAGLELHEHKNTATLKLSVPDAESLESRVGVEFSTVALLRLIRSFVGQDAVPRRFYFAYPAPSHRAEYTRLLAGKEHFDHPFSGVEIDRAWLDTPPRCQHAELRSFLQTRADFLLAKVDQTVPMSERVRHWLAANAWSGQPRMAAIARDLGTSVRSLHRSLREENAQFSALIEESRIAKAMSLLADSTRSMAEIAAAVGFATPSAFSRAFKRWTGAAPTAHRNAL